MTSVTSYPPILAIPTQKPEILPADEMAEAGRKILAYHFAKMLKELPVILEGHNVEAIHDMRVATRRMRSALRLFRFYYKRSATRPLNQMLRQTADMLGMVRDLDVFRLKAETHAETLSARERGHFRAFLSSIQQKEVQARAALLDYLHAPEFGEFLERSRDFVQTIGEGNRELEAFDEVGHPLPRAVRDVLPQLIYGQVGLIRAYEPYLANASLDTLHGLRIEAKRLRYMLEAFGSVLGPEGKQAIDAVKALQDFLGDLQDARVAHTMLTLYLNDGIHAKTPMQRRTIRDYMKARQHEQDDLRAGVGSAWAAFNDLRVRHAFAEAIAAL